MDRYNDLKSVTRHLTVLYAEDEEIARTIVENRLKALFKDVLLVSDGMEGLEKYRRYNIDLILTDNLMPVMNGLDFIKEVRKTDIKTPIILITAHMDTDFLIKAINLGVTQFVAKPISFDNLTKAIEISVQRVIIENLAQKSREQELELLRYREKYHSAQQERAFRKELNIIKNDLYLKRIDAVGRDGEKSAWLIDLYYKPLDILSGDSYSIRETGPDNVLLFLVDAMGKGLSASVTTILSTSFVNHLVNELKESGRVFSLRDFISVYIKFIQRELLDDEIVCASFIHIDFRTEVMETAIFSMPSVVIQMAGGAIVKVKSNNLPIMKFLADFRVEEHDISSSYKILVYSDGLNESINNMDTLYDDSLIEDFSASETKNELFNRFKSKIERPDDDVTFLFLKRIRCNVVWSRRFVITSRLQSLSKLTQEVEALLLDNGVGDEIRVTLINSFTEVLMNAYEHGNLSIDSSQKNVLIRDGVYEEYLLKTEADVDKMIAVEVAEMRDSRRNLLMLSVSDEGSGFDTSCLIDNLSEPKRLNGRGITIAHSFSDELYYNRKGNEVTLIRHLPRRTECKT